MLTYAKLKETSIGKFGRRFLKVLELGVKTAKECAPFGLDSAPNVENMTAIYAKTSNTSENVIIGYIQKNQLAEPGETRLFSLDANGALSAFIWAHNDGTLDLNGDDYTAVRYAALNAALQAQVLKINAELAAIATGITGVGGVYVPTMITLDVSAAESPDVKLK